MTRAEFKALARRERANVVSLHQRALRSDPAAVGALLAGFYAPDSPLWPHAAWPRDLCSGPMGEGCIGGHGATRYRLERYVPGEQALFRFIAPRGYRGAWLSHPGPGGRTHLPEPFHLPASEPVSPADVAPAGALGA